MWGFHEKAVLPKIYQPVSYALTVYFPQHFQTLFIQTSPYKVILIIDVAILPLTCHFFFFQILSKFKIEVNTVCMWTVNVMILHALQFTWYTLGPKQKSLQTRLKLDLEEVSPICDQLFRSNITVLVEWA